MGFGAAALRGNFTVFRRETSSAAVKLVRETGLRPPLALEAGRGEEVIGTTSVGEVTVAGNSLICPLSVSVRRMATSDEFETVVEGSVGTVGSSAVKSITEDNDSGVLGGM